MNLADYVLQHTNRGECKCGMCCDVGTKPDPEGHTVNMVFFKMAKVGEPTLEEFKRLTKEHEGRFAACDPFDGKEHGFIELGAWVGDQGIAMQYMGLGVLLGAFKLLSPATVLGIEGPKAMEIAGMGYLTIRHD